MTESIDWLSMLGFLLGFVLSGGLCYLVVHRMEGDERLARERLRRIGQDASLPSPSLTWWQQLKEIPQHIGHLILPPEGPGREKLKERLTHAGLYQPTTLQFFLGLRVLLPVGCALVALLGLFLLGYTSMQVLLLGLVVGVSLGILLPGLGLDRLKHRRQQALRRGLPDALDMIVLCIEGGISLSAAIQRVMGELKSIHPLLSTEMNIITREMQMGETAGSAMNRFADRCGLEEARDLTSVLLQSERFGSGVVRALRLYADTAREERQQRAEEMAQKAAVKILFPTLLFIFPAIFIVLLGPAAYQISGMINQMK